MIFNVNGFKFVRTLGIEKAFREETGTEFNAQLVKALEPIVENIDQKGTGVNNTMLAGLLDLNHVEVLEELVAWMFAGLEGSANVSTSAKLREEAHDHMDAGDFAAMEVVQVMLARFLG